MPEIGLPTTRLVPLLCPLPSLNMPTCPAAQVPSRGPVRTLWNHWLWGTWALGGFLNCAYTRSVLHVGYCVRGPLSFRFERNESKQ